jgi:dsDNA-binding SOS-regulon protein
MTQPTIKDIKNKMSQALALIKEALNMSIPLLKTEQRENIVALWEAFIREFMGFIKQRSKEAGANLMSYISIRRIWLR